MVDQNDRKPEDVPESSGGSEAEETTADNAAERLYDEGEAWKQSKNTLFFAMGLIAATVGIVTYLNRVGDENAGERSYQYVSASLDAEKAEEHFLAFADDEDHDDTLAGVSRYRAAVVQYQAGDYAKAASTFAKAAEELGDLPPNGRAMLGRGVSLLKAGNAKEGKAALQGIVDLNASNANAIEARYLLAVQALQEGDDAAFDEQEKALGSDEANSALLERLARYRKTKSMVAKSRSLSDRNADRGKAYLDKNKARAGVNVLESGLHYKVLVDGNGSIPTDSDEVEVHYHGTLVDGEVFDSSIERGEPSSFGVTGVIEGWTEALKLMKVGSKWKLAIPPDIAYGENGSGSIGPNETLVFEVELLGITEKELPQTEVNATAVLDANSTISIDANGTVAPVRDVNVTNLNSTDANGSQD